MKSVHASEKRNTSDSSWQSAILFVALVLAVNWVLRFALCDDIMMKHNIMRCTSLFHEDILIGTSQCRAAVDPGTMEDITGRETTNASIPLSSPLDQYYLVRQMVQSGHQPKRLIYECDPYYFMETRCGGHSYAYPFGLNRLQYFLASAGNDWRIAFSPWAFQVRNYGRIRQIITDKLLIATGQKSPDYNGFVYNTSPFVPVANYDREFVVSGTADEYMRRLISYCDEQGIELVLMMTPVSDTVYYEYEPRFRTGADAYFTDLQREYGITYWNMNLLPDEVFDKSLERFIDTEGHMKGETAMEFSTVLSEMLNELEETGEVTLSPLRSEKDDGNFSADTVHSSSSGVLAVNSDDKAIVPFQPSTFAILGDSYSTFEGCIPEDYFNWYVPGSNGLASSDDTWWGILGREHNLELLTNCSYSGSCVSYTGYPGFDALQSSFIFRMKREFGILAAQNQDPDILIIFGGTNDYWNENPMGDIHYGIYDELQDTAGNNAYGDTQDAASDKADYDVFKNEELKSFAPAFCYMVEYLMELFPDTKILNVINDEILEGPVRQTQLEVCDHYQIDVVELHDIEKENVHPNLAGMREIARQIGEKIDEIVAANAADFRIANLTMRYGTPQQITDSEEDLQFCWQMESTARGKKQTAYEIYVSDTKEQLTSLMTTDERNDSFLWDSGKVESDRSSYISYEGASLEPRHNYWWCVRVWDEKGISVLSEPACFETALMYEGFAGASWIAAPEEEHPAASRSASSEEEKPAASTTVISGSEASIPASSDEKLQASVSSAAEQAPESIVIEADFELEDSAYSVGFVWGYHRDDFGMYRQRVVCNETDNRILLITDYIRKYMPEWSDEQDITDAILGTADDRKSSDSAEQAGSDSSEDIEASDENDPVRTITAAQWKALPHHIRITVSGTEVITQLDGSARHQGTDSSSFVTHLENERTLPGDVGFHQDRGSRAWIDHYKVTCFAGNASAASDNGTVLYDESFDDPYNTVFGDQYVEVLNGRMRAGGAVLLTPGEYYDGLSAPVFRRKFSLSASRKTVDASGNSADRSSNTAGNSDNSDNPDSADHSEAAITRARLYMTAAGMYLCRINGCKVTDSWFLPGNTAYNIRTDYQAFDVTDLLQEGDNTIEVTLGHGWYDRAVGFDGVGAVWGDHLALLGRLVIDLADGSRQEIWTDDSWLVSRQGPVRQDDFWQGEVYDARKETAEFLSVAVVNHPVWFTGTVSLQTDPPVEAVETLEPVSVSETEAGRLVYDFGREISGVCRIQMKGKSGDVITIRHGEWINDDRMRNADGPAGTIFTHNLGGAQQTDRYILRGSGEDGEVFMPELTFHGFRYAEIELSSPDIEINKVEAIVLSSLTQETSSFESSDQALNRMYEAARRSVLGNTISIPTDCPQRSERFGWSGDAQIIAETAMYFTNAASFYKDYVRDLSEVQAENGAVPDMAPRNLGTDLQGRGGPGGNNGWGDAMVLIPWRLYCQYGDIGVLETYYDSMSAWADFLMTENENWIRPESGYGDHLSQDTAAMSCINTAWSAHTCDLMSRIALLLGKGSDAEKYANAYEQFRAAWTSHWLAPDGTINAGSEGAYVLGLAFDLVPDACFEALVQEIHANGDHISTGFAGISYIIPLLWEKGYEELALTLLRQDSAPSILYCLNHGGTTIWESMNAYQEYDDGTYSISGSLNHFAFGSIAASLLTQVGGIQSDPSVPGFYHVILAPGLGAADESLHYADTSYQSIMGEISCSWDSKETSCSCFVPANATATLYLPVISGHEWTEGGSALDAAIGIASVRKIGDQLEIELESGSYEFR